MISRTLSSHLLRRVINIFFTAWIIGIDFFQHSVGFGEVDKVKRIFDEVEQASEIALRELPLTEP